MLLGSQSSTLPSCSCGFNHACPSLCYCLGNGGPRTVVAINVAIKNAVAFSYLIIPSKSGCCPLKSPKMVLPPVCWTPNRTIGKIGGYPIYFFWVFLGLTYVKISVRYIVETIPAWSCVGFATSEHVFCGVFWGFWPLIWLSAWPVGANQRKTRNPAVLETMTNLAVGYLLLCLVLLYFHYCSTYICCCS